MISRARSPACPSSPASTCSATRPARRSTSARRASLRDRVRSYLGARGTSPKTDALLDEAAGLEVIVTDSVVEALALENNLIKQRTPKYNILLRDDKNYPYLQADDQRGVPARAGGAARRAGRQRLRRPVPARQPGAPDDGADAPAVRHPVVQRGDHGRRAAGRASSTTSSGASRRASTTICARGRYARGRRATRGCSSKGATTSCVERLRPADGRGGRRRSASSRRRTCATRCARSQTLRDRQQKMATVELGDRDAFGVQDRARPAPSSRCSRCAAAAWSSASSSLNWRTMPAATSGQTDADASRRCCRRRCQQFYADREVPPEIHVPLALAEAEVARGVAVGARRPARARRRCRSAARSAACSTSPRATPRMAYQSRFNAGRRGPLRGARDAARRARPAGAAAAHRVLRHLDDPGQRDGRVDGRLRGRPDEAVGVPEVPDARGSASEPASAVAEPDRAAVPRRLRRDARGGAAPLPRACSSRAARSRT